VETKARKPKNRLKPLKNPVLVNLGRWEIANVVDVPVVAEDIMISHKLNTRGGKAIIAKFINHKVKSSLYRARIKLKNIMPSVLFPVRQQHNPTGSSSTRT